MPRVWISFSSPCVACSGTLWPKLVPRKVKSKDDPAVGQLPDIIYVPHQISAGCLEQAPATRLPGRKGAAQIGDGCAALPSSGTGPLDASSEQLHLVDRGSREDAL